MVASSGTESWLKTARRLLLASLPPQGSEPVKELAELPPSWSWSDREV